VPNHYAKERNVKGGSISFKRETRELENENLENVEKSVGTLLTVVRYVPRIMIYVCIDLQLGTL
jgi:hypothetical protein